MSQYPSNPRRPAAPVPPQAASAQRQTTPLAPSQDGEAQGMSVDGFGQVLSMLQFADEAFRNSILRRIAQRDRNLALRLHRALNEN